MNPAPRGRGLYIRDPEGTFEAALATCQWAAIQPGGKLAARVTVLRDREIPFWIYTTPGQWTPSRGIAECDRLASIARETGAQGFFLDREPAPRQGDPANQEYARALGRKALEHVRGGLSVIATSYPTWPELAAFMTASEGQVPGSPQPYALAVYHQRGPGWISDVFGYWRERGARTIIPSLSAGIWEKDGFRPPDDLAFWRTYYGAVPDARAAIGWPISGPTGNVLAAWREYTPSVIPVEGDRLVSAAERTLGLPIEAIAGLLGTLAVLLVFGLWFLGR